jgi:hypothetical protein
MVLLGLNEMNSFGVSLQMKFGNIVNLMGMIWFKLCFRRKMDVQITIK